MDTIQVVIDRTTHAAVVQNLAEQLKAYYVFPDIAEQISTRLQKYLDDGAYADITDGELFSETLTGHLQEVNQDKHLRVFWFPTPRPEL